MAAPAQPMCICGNVSRETCWPVRTFPQTLRIKKGSGEKDKEAANSVKGQRREKAEQAEASECLAGARLGGVCRAGRMTANPEQCCCDTQKEASSKKEGYFIGRQGRDPGCDRDKASQDGAKAECDKQGRQGATQQRADTGKQREQGGEREVIHGG